MAGHEKNTFLDNCKLSKNYCALKWQFHRLIQLWELIRSIQYSQGYTHNVTMGSWHKDPKRLHRPKHTSATLPLITSVSWFNKSTIETCTTFITTVTGRPHCYGNHLARAARLKKLPNSVCPHQFRNQEKRWAAQAIVARLLETAVRHSLPHVGMIENNVRYSIVALQTSPRRLHADIPHRRWGGLHN